MKKIFRLTLFLVFFVSPTLILSAAAKPTPTPLGIVPSVKPLQEPIQPGVKANFQQSFGGNADNVNYPASNQAQNLEAASSSLTNENNLAPEQKTNPQSPEEKKISAANEAVQKSGKVSWAWIIFSVVGLAILSGAYLYGKNQKN